MYKMKEIRRAIRRDRDLRGMVVKSGAKDAILLDVTEDKMPDIALLDTTGDGYVDAVALDLDGNGYFDTLLADTDGNDVPDTVILGDLDNGTIREVIRGEDVEDAIIDAVNLIVSAVMLDLFTRSLTLSYTSWRRVCARQKKPKRRPRSTRSACSAQRTARIGWRNSRRKSRGWYGADNRSGEARPAVGCLPNEAAGMRAQDRPAAARPAARTGRRAKTVFPAGPPPRPVLYADRILRALRR